MTTIQPKKAENARQSSSDVVSSYAPKNIETKELKEIKVKLERFDFGQTATGTPVERFVVENNHGYSMSLISYGAIMQAFHMPGRDGTVANVNLGTDSIEAYEKCVAYFGATVGRFCNRIGKGQFELDGTQYKLAVNNPPNSLHGGIVGFSHAVWNCETIEESDRAGIRFSHTSPDGDEGYPGEMKVVAEYVLTDANELLIEFRAETNKPTVVNLTNHNYWNLAGGGKVLDHQLQIHADHVLDVDDTLIPTGQFQPVENSPLDFRQTHSIGAQIDELKKTPANGYDHCYVVRREPNQERTLTSAALISDPASGRTMEVLTTQPGIQLYTGNWMSGDEGSCGFGENEAFCLETQHYPDAPNVSSFPTTRLNPGETFRETTVHRFSVSE